MRMAWIVDATAERQKPVAWKVTVSGLPLRSNNAAVDVNPTHFSRGGMVQRGLRNMNMSVLMAFRYPALEPRQSSINTLSHSSIHASQRPVVRSPCNAAAAIVAAGPGSCS